MRARILNASPPSMLVSQEGASGAIVGHVPLESKDYNGELAPFELALAARRRARSRNPIVR